MKKTVLGLAMVILGLGIPHLNAQGITGGVKAGVNISNFILSDMGSAESTMNAGANLGGFMKIDLSDHFAIQPELMFHFKSSDMEQAGFKDTYEYWGMDIPVYAMAQWTVQRDRRFFVGVGPYIGLGFSSKYKDLDTDL